MKSRLSAYRRQIAAALVAGLAVAVPSGANAAINRQDVAEFTISQKLQAIREATTTATKAVDAGADENVKVAWWNNWHNWHNWHNWNNWHNWHNWHNW